MKRKAQGDRVPAQWCGGVADEFVTECQARDKYLGLTKWKMAELEVAESVVAESVSVAEEKVAEPKVPLLEFRKEEEHKRRAGDITEEKEEVGEVRELIAGLGPRAIWKGLLGRVGKESV